MDGSLSPKAIKEMILYGLDRPTVFRNRIDHWSCRTWDLKRWSDAFGPRRLRFRIGPIESHESGPIWETDCDYVQATMDDFVRWQSTTGAATSSSSSSSSSPSSSSLSSASRELSKVDPSKNWVYADYKHLAQLFDEGHEIHRCIDWSPFGYDGRGGQTSTVWIGSRSSQTPCHYDTYGCNLVAQLMGRKRWIMFAPTDSKNLYPTRIPYEESSVFARVDIANPDPIEFPKYSLAVQFAVVLHPGDVLFVPHKWWHFVTSLDTSISVNTWLELSSDDECRLEESITRMLMSSLTAVHPLKTVEWLNPTEEEISPEDNLFYVRESLGRCLESGPSQMEMEMESRRRNGATATTTAAAIVKHYGDIVRLVEPSAVHLSTEAKFDNKEGEEEEQEEEEEEEEQDRSRIALFDAVCDAEVVALICKKLKRTVATFKSNRSSKVPLPPETG